MMLKNKLIIFDMDNTLIHSHLDFTLMKSETCRMLRDFGFEPCEQEPVARILNRFISSGLLHPEQAAEIWRRVGEIEHEGLREAGPEPGIELVLSALAREAHLVALTNTNQPAARAALHRLGLSGYLEHIMGRGAAPELKPGPGGMLALLAQYPHLKATDALAVGDALIDIQAARAANLAFCAYNRSRAERWPGSGYTPDLQLMCWDEAAVTGILALF